MLFGQPKAIADIYYFKDSISIKVMLKIDLEKDWHLYWLNSGDSGIPTEISWELPNGFDITKTYWPVPKAFETDGLVSYGYENSTIIIFDIVSTNISNMFDKVFTLELNSLICKEVCIPFDTVISFKLSEIKKVDDLSKLILSHKLKFPENSNDLHLKAFMNTEKVILEFSAPDIKSNIKEISVFPFENGVFKNVMKNSFIFNSDKYSIDLFFDQFKTHVPDKLEGLLLIDFEDSEVIKNKAYEFSVRL